MNIIKFIFALAILVSAVASQGDRVFQCYENTDCSIVLCAYQDPSECASTRTIQCGCCEVCEITLPEGGSCAPFLPTNEACAPGVPCVGGTCQSNKDKGKCTGK